LDASKEKLETSEPKRDYNQIELSDPAPNIRSNIDDAESTPE